MKPVQPSPHAARVATLAAEYAANGYAVQLAPTALPFDLGGYVPDLLAEKDGEHLLIEVKDAAVPVSFSRFREVVETVRQVPGWRFLLVANPASEVTVLGLPPEPLAWPDIASRIQQAKRLHDAGESEAAILVFWSALEALLRRHAESIDLPIERLPVTALVDYLYSEAELSFEQFDRAKALMTGRNRLTHGFPLPEAQQNAAQLQGLIDELTNDWQQLDLAA